jgi:hypothetical protein
VLEDAVVVFVMARNPTVVLGKECGWVALFEFYGFPDGLATAKKPLYIFVSYQ